METLKQLQKIRNTDNLVVFISFVLSENLYPSLKLHKKLTPPELSLLTEFIQKQLTKEQKSGFLKEEKDCFHAVQKVLFLHKLSQHLSLEETKLNLQTAIEYVYNLSQNRFSPTCPVLRPEVYAFIDAEISNLKERKVEHPLEEVLSTLMTCFTQAQNLPEIEEEEFEILVWKILQDIYPTSERLPNYLKETLSDELANISIDHPKEPFQKIITISLNYLKKIHSLDTTQLEKKATLWAIQNDMLCKFLHFDENTPLLKLISRVWKSFESAPLSHNEFIEKVLAIYLKNNASLTQWQSVLHTRVAIMYKYFWYNTLSEEKETSYDRFLKWHLHAILSENQKEFPELSLHKLENVSKKLVPLAPFNPKFFAPSK